MNARRLRQLAASSAVIGAVALVALQAGVAAGAPPAKYARVTSRALPPGAAVRFASSSTAARVRIVFYRLRHVSERITVVKVGIENVGTRATARIHPAATVNDRRGHTYGLQPGVSPRIGEARLRPGQRVLGYLSFRLRPLAKVTGLNVSPFGNDGTRAQFKLREHANGRTTVLPEPKPTTSAAVTSKGLPPGIAVRTAKADRGARGRIVFYRLTHLANGRIAVKLGIENVSSRVTARIDPAASITDSEGHTYGLLGGVSPRLDAATLRPGQSIRGYLTFSFGPKAKLRSLQISPFGPAGTRAQFKLRERPNGRTIVLPAESKPATPAKVTSRRLPRGVADRTADSRSRARVKVVFYRLLHPPNRAVGPAGSSGHPFVAIKIGIENLGSRGVRIDPAASITDTEGHTYGLSGGVSPKVVAARLRPGQSIRGYLTFSFGRKAKVHSLQVSPFARAGTRVLFKLRERANGRTTVIPNPIPPRLAKPTSRPLPRGQARRAQTATGARVRVVLSKLMRPSNLLVGSTPPPGRRFLAARIGIRNMASETVRLTPAASLTDSRGHTSGFSLRVSPRLGQASLQPGQSIIGYVTFGPARFGRLASLQLSPFGHDGTRAVFQLRARRR